MADPKPAPRTFRDRLLLAVLHAARPSRWSAGLCFAMGAALLLANSLSIWSAAWRHAPGWVMWTSIVALGFAASICAMGARLWYLAGDYKEFVRIRDSALAVKADVDAFLGSIKDSQARGGEIVGVVIREPITGARLVEMDDEPRVIN